MGSSQSRPMKRLAPDEHRERQVEERPRRNECVASGCGDCRVLRAVRIAEVQAIAGHSLPSAVMRSRAGDDHAKAVDDAGEARLFVEMMSEPVAVMNSAGAIIVERI